MAKGPPRAVTTSHLMTHLGPKPISMAKIVEDCTFDVSRREVEKAVELARVEGLPICSGPRGVWVTSDADELLENYRRLRRRALRQLVNLRQMQRTAAALRGVEQTSLWAA